MSRAQTLQRVAEATAARQKFLDMMYARSEAEEAQRQGEFNQQQVTDNKNWLSEGLQGASLGSAAGPWGTLVGAIAGTAIGQKKAYDQRRKEGQGTGESLWRTLFDFEQVGDLSGQDMGNASNAYANTKGSIDRQRMERSTAANHQERQREARMLELENAVANGEYGDRYRNYQTPRQSYSGYNPAPRYQKYDALGYSSDAA